MFVDCVITAKALQFFYIRMIAENDLDVKNKQVIEQKYEKIYSNEKLSKFIDKYWGNKKMIRTFPNLKIESEQGEIIYFDSLLPDIQAYYYDFK